MNPWLSIAAVLASLALIGAFFALCANHKRKLENALHERRRARRHDFYENRRSITNNLN